MDEQQAADADTLILVDENDRDVGRMSKARCHDGDGVLHRAFSLLIFNPRGELLLQQRAAGKRLWPLYWSNSCCSHPRAGEDMQTATRRRLDEELGLACELQFLFKFQYQARFEAQGSENELCWVFIGCSGHTPRVNAVEILAWRWVDPDALQAEMDSAGAARFTPWFLTEWTRIREHHWGAVRGLRASA